MATIFNTHLRLRFQAHIAVTNRATAHRMAKKESETMISLVLDRSPHREPTQNPKLTRNTPVLGDAIAILSYLTESLFRKLIKTDSQQAEKNDRDDGFPDNQKITCVEVTGSCTDTR